MKLHPSFLVPLLAVSFIAACQRPTTDSRQVAQLISDSELMLDADDADSAWTLLTQAYDLALHARSAESKAEVLLAMSRHHNMMDRPDSAVSCLHRGLSVNPRAADDVLAQYYAELSATYNILGDMRSSVAWARKALPLFQRFGSDEDYAILCGNTGIAYRRLGNNDSAAIFYRQGLERAIQAEDEASQAYLANNLSVLYVEMGRYDEGVQYAEKAIACAARAGDDVERLSAQANKGIALQMSKRPAAAIELLTTTFAEADSTNSTPLKLKVINYLLKALVDARQWDAAASYLQKGEAIASQLPPANTAAAGILESKMIVQTERGNYEGALQTIGRLDTLMRQQQVIPRFRLMTYKGKALAGMGRYREAYQLQAEAAALSDSVRSRESADKLDQLTTNIRVMEKELQLSRLSRKQAQTQRTVVALLAIVGLLLASLGVLILWLRGRRQQALMRETRKYVEGIEQERARFARELHDGACNDLLAIGMQLRGPAPDITATTQQIATLRAQLRNLSHELMPPQFTSGIHLDEALGHYLSHLEKPVIQFSAEGSGYEHVPPAIAYQFYRIAQEAIGNVIVHQTDAHVAVQLTRDNAGRLDLSITSAGTCVPGDGTGVGFQSMRERAESIGANLTTEQTSDGFSLRLSAP